MKNKSTFKTLFRFLGRSSLFLLPLSIWAQTPGEDMTSRIINPDFEGEQTRVLTSQSIVGGGSINIPNGWTLNKALGGWNGLDLKLNPVDNPSYHGSKHYDLWKASVKEMDFSQIITSLPAGKYELKAAMKVPQEHPEYVTDQHLYTIADVDGITYKSQTLSSASAGPDKWEILSIIFNLSTNQNLTIGAAVTGPDDGTPAGWFAIDDFHLTYLGEAEPLNMEDIMNALAEKEKIANQLPSDNPPYGTYQTLINAGNEYADMPGDVTLEEAQGILARYTQAIKDVQEGKLLYDTLYSYINKSKDVSSDLPNYAEFEQLYLEQEDIMNAVESTNKEFKEAIATLRKAYEDINLNNMNLATQEEGRDASWLINNPRFTKAAQEASDFTASTTENWNVNYAYSNLGTYWIGMGLVSAGPDDNEKVNAYNFNAWDYTFVEICQELHNLPEGTYTLSSALNFLSLPADGWIYATTKEDNKIKNPSYAYDPKAETPAPFWETVTTDKFYVGKDGYLKIGFYSKNPTGWNWIGVNITDFKLKYYGKKGSADKLVDALIEEAKSLKDSVEIQHMIMPVEKEELATIIEQAENAEDKNQVFQPLKDAIAHVKESVTLYPQVEVAMSEANDYLSLGLNMAEDKDIAEFEELINKQLMILQSDTTSRYALISMKKDLYQGSLTFQFQLTKQASENFPVNLTLAILNPEIKDIENSIPSGWTCNRNIIGNYTNLGEHFSGNRENRYIDANCSTAGQLKFTAKQTLVVPNGTYILQCAGRSNGAGVYLFANNTEKLYTERLDSCGNTAGSIWTIAAPSSPQKEVNGAQGYGWSQTVLSSIEVTKRSLEIGITTDTDINKGEPWKGTWLSADDFTLTCIKGEGWVGIDEVNADKDDELISSVYVENGVIKVEGCEEYIIRDLSGMILPHHSILLPGIYIVTVKDLQVKVAVE